MKILNTLQVTRKVKRLAIAIHSRHLNDNKLYLAGINRKGYQLAQLLLDELQTFSSREVILISLNLNPASPLDPPVMLSIDVREITGNPVVIVDDVANTGRTLFYACRPFMDVLPSSIETAALVDRQHKSYPIHVDYVGLSLATTLHDNIEVNFLPGQSAEAFLG